MSVWTTVSGTVTIESKHHFSVAKSIKENFESSNPIVKRYYSDQFNISFSFVEDGVAASKQIQNWVDNVLPSGSRADLCAEVRFLK